MLDSIAIGIFSIIFLVILRYTWWWIVGLIAIVYIMTWFLSGFGFLISMGILDALQIQPSPFRFLVAWVGSLLLFGASLGLMMISIDKSPN